MMNIFSYQWFGVMVLSLVGLFGVLSPDIVNGQVFASLECQADGTTEINLSWSLVNPADQPAFFEITNSNQPQTAVVPGNVTSWTIPGDCTQDVICIIAADAAGNPIQTLCCGSCGETVQDLGCIASPGSPGLVSLQWSNSDAYTGITISVNGTDVVSLMGNITSYQITDLNSGCNTVCVTPQIGATILASVCCEVWGGFPPCEPTISCTESSNSTVDITWGTPAWTCNGSIYGCVNFQQVRITVSSVLGEFTYLPAQFASSFSLGGFDLDSYAYTICLQVVGSADEYCCTVGCIFCPVPPPVEQYRRADPTDDGAVDLGDVVKTLAYLFQGGSMECTSSADVNADGSVDVGDVINLLAYLFLDGPEPPPPFMECGVEETEDELDCEQSTSCN